MLGTFCGCTKAGGAMWDPCLWMEGT
jgi:hypothetical protein